MTIQGHIENHIEYWREPPARIISIRFDDDLLGALAKAVSREKRSRANVIRLAIKQGLIQRGVVYEESPRHVVGQRDG